MQTVRAMIRDPAIWAGLNRPDLPLEDADAVVLGVPYDGGVSFRAGAAEAPRALRAITYTIDPTTEDLESFRDFRVRDLGDACAPTRDQLFAQVEQAARDVVRQGALLTVIGGDHSITIPVLRGIDKALGAPFAIVHIDAHLDLCEQMHGDPLSHGSTERRALELEHVAGPEAIFFVGIRSIESAELSFVRAHPLRLIGARALRRLSVPRALEAIHEALGPYRHVYVTVDVDALDPAVAPGTGTPQSGGLDARELLDLLRGVFTLPVVGFDVVEAAPPLDPTGATMFCVRKIVTECWGHRARRLGKLAPPPQLR